MAKGSEGVGSGALGPIEHSAKVKSLISFQVHWELLEDAERSSEIDSYKFSNLF